MKKCVTSVETTWTTYTNDPSVCVTLSDGGKLHILESNFKALNAYFCPKDAATVKYLTITEAQELAAETAKLKERKRCLNAVKVVRDDLYERDGQYNLYAHGALLPAIVAIENGDEEDQRKAKEEAAKREREYKLRTLANIVQGRVGCSGTEARCMVDALPTEALEAALATVKLP